VADDRPPDPPDDPGDHPADDGPPVPDVGPAPAKRPTLRRTWRIGGSLAAVCVLGFGTLQSVTRLAHEEETVTRRLDGAGLELIDVRNSAGSVHIVGTQGDSVTVRARVSHGLRSTGESVRRDGDRLVLRGTCPVIGSDFCTVTYNVEVPRDIDVRIRADAAITVSDVSGDVDASTDNGRVEAARVTGDVDLDSDNGRVVGTDLRAGTAHAESDNGRVEMGFLASPRTLEARSDNGSVEVVLPRTSSYYRIVDVSSDNGSAATPEIRIDPESRRTITATSDNGDVTVRYASR
jgi:Putative adhesin